jgi:hypothetical protein
MYNIIKIKNGFIFNDIEYIFKNQNEILSNSQVLISTNYGEILLDLSCSIERVTFDNIENFVTELYK